MYKHLQIKYLEIVNLTNIFQNFIYMSSLKSIIIIIIIIVYCR